MNDASLTEEPVLPQNADPVAFGGKYAELALGIPWIKYTLDTYLERFRTRCTVWFITCLPVLIHHGEQHDHLLSVQVHCM